MRALLLLAVAACGGAPPAAPPPVIANATPVAPAPAPVAKSRLTIEPDKGDADGGTYVRIVVNRGRGFLADGPPAAKIYFGSVQGMIVRFASDTELIVQAPGGKAGETVDVLLMLEGQGELKIAQAFTFVDKH
jgi:hypothetical protein